MTDRFEEFWSLFPRKVAKRAARKEWDKEMRAGTDPSEIISGLKAQLPTLARKEQQFIPHARTWLHQGRWEDEPEQAKPQTYAERLRSKMDGSASRDADRIDVCGIPDGQGRPRLAYADLEDGSAQRGPFRHH